MTPIYPSFSLPVKNFRWPRNARKNGPLNLFLDEIQYLFSTYTYFIMKLIKESAPQTQLLVITALFQDRFPGLSERAALAAAKILLYFNTVKKFFTTNCELQSLTGYRKTVLKEITQELEAYQVIFKETSPFFNGYQHNNKTLILQLNLVDLAELVDERPQTFFASFIENRTIQSEKGHKCRIARLKDVYNERNTIHMNNFFIKHTPETSKFLESLVNEDRLTFSFNARSLDAKGAPRPLFKTLTVHRGQKTFKARLTDKETSVTYGAGESKHVWLTNNESYKHNLTIPIADIRNLTAAEIAVVDNLEIGDRVLFEAEVEVALEGSKVKAKIVSRPTGLRSAYQ